ncbi:MarR family EPS-associated transcriptional regulator [Rhodovulum marinum]|uniref:AsnC family transcriptional regulator n=1 Tax=Rhodovulum marinum TaxID=320662 RepID=A0A4V2SQJ9_9RHOB|nr:MarR family EPS-associated transcriptional regulator [Rhodovulum marinum]TCP39286.1 AsnC family transcriptional regulator [Rhodovulum marinum]
MTRPAADDVRFRVLQELSADPNISQRELSDRLGVSLGRMNYCLRALIEKGLLKTESFRASDNKLRYAYLLTPRGLSERSRLAHGFLMRKMAEYEALKAEIATLQRDFPPPEPGAAPREEGPGNRRESDE